MSINFHKVATLPLTLENDSIYYVQNGDYAEAYIVNNSGVAKAVGNSVMINTLIDSKLATFQSGIVVDVASIAERDALSLDKNALVLVYNASADATVNAGAAIYYFDYSNTTWTKVMEYESIDFTLTWDSITGKPSSSAAQIDSAVSQSHSHDNKTFLDKIGEESGKMTYAGTAISGDDSSKQLPLLMAEGVYAIHTGSSNIWYSKLWSTESNAYYQSRGNASTPNFISIDKPIGLLTKGTNLSKAIVTFMGNKALDGLEFCITVASPTDEVSDWSITNTNTNLTHYKGTKSPIVTGQRNGLTIDIGNVTLSEDSIIFLYMRYTGTAVSSNGALNFTATLF